MKSQLIQMKFLPELIKIDRTSDTPVFLQISNAIIQAIRQGHLKRGSRLPGSRPVSELLKLNRMTIVAAYDEIASQGWIEMHPRKGVFIKNDLPELSPRKIVEKQRVFVMPHKTFFSYDEKRIVPYPISDFPESGKLIFNDGFPDSRLAPIELLFRSMRSSSRLSTNRKYLMYGGAQGTLLLRETLAEFLNATRGLPITVENILVTKGATMGIYLATSIIVKPNEEIVVGAPGYSGANFTFTQLGAKINYVPVDENGINVDAIEKICKRKKVKMVFVIPHHHNPTTVSLTPERRIRLLELSIKYKFAILEDDYDYDFHYSSKPLMPMASLDRHGNVIYVGTLTKTLAPAIRIGFIVGPKDFIKAATQLRKVIDTQGDSLLENAIAELYRDGTIARHIKKSVKLYRERRDHLCTLLYEQLNQHVSFKIPHGGMSVWTKFETVSLPKVAALASTKGLVVDPGIKYNILSTNFNSTRLGFASLNFQEQKRAVDILKKCIEEIKK